jgi:hypothetical protein
VSDAAGENVSVARSPENSPGPENETYFENVFWLSLKGKREHDRGSALVRFFADGYAGDSLSASDRRRRVIY